MLFIFVLGGQVGWLNQDVDDCNGEDDSDSDKGDYG